MMVFYRSYNFLVFDSINFVLAGLRSLKVRSLFSVLVVCISGCF